MQRKNTEAQSNTTFYLASGSLLACVLLTLDYLVYRKYQNSGINILIKQIWPTVKESNNTAPIASAIISPATSFALSFWSTSRIRGEEIRYNQLLTDMSFAYTEGMEAMHAKDYYHASQLFHKARKYLGKLYQNHHTNKFKRQLETAYFNEAKALYFLNKGKAALSLLDIILTKLNPNNIDALNLRGIYYMKLTFSYFEGNLDSTYFDNIKKSKEDFLVSYKLSNNFNDIAIFLHYILGIEALLESEKGKGKEKDKSERRDASYHYKHIIDHFSFPPREAYMASDLLFVLGIAYKQKGLLKEAVSAFEAALYCTTNTPAFYCDQASILTCCASAYEELSNRLRDLIKKGKLKADSVIEFESRVTDIENRKLNLIEIEKISETYREQASELKEEIAFLISLSTEQMDGTIVEGGASLKNGR